MKIFRDLTPAEEIEFRKWARETYQPFTKISGVWHPVVQDECIKINKENAEYITIPLDNFLKPK